MDSTGLELRSKGAYYLFRMERGVRRRDFLKAHLACEVRGKEKPIYGCLVTPGGASDGATMIPLLEAVKGSLATVAADGAYGWRANVQYVADRGATPFLKTRRDVRARAEGYPAWRRMVLARRMDPEGWLEGYNPRANAEAVIWSLKQRHGRGLFSRRPDAREVEVLLKAIVYNLRQRVKQMTRLALGR